MFFVPAQFGLPCNPCVRFCICVRLLFLCYRFEFPALCTPSHTAVSVERRWSSVLFLGLNFVLSGLNQYLQSYPVLLNASFRALRIGKFWPTQQHWISEVPASLHTAFEVYRPHIPVASSSDQPPLKPSGNSHSTPCDSSLAPSSTNPCLHHTR